MCNMSTGLRFIQVVLCIIFIPESQQCVIDICLTWTYNNDQLKLTCIVNDLLYMVEFLNPLDEEQGYCVSPTPQPDCFNYNNRVTLEQKGHVTNMTVRGLTKNQLDGSWKCKHGSNIDKTSVTILVPDTDVHKDENHETCWETFFTWTIIGFTGSYIMVYVVFVGYAYLKRTSFSGTNTVLCCRRKETIECHSPTNQSSAENADGVQLQNLRTSGDNNDTSQTIQSEIERNEFLPQINPTRATSTAQQTGKTASKARKLIVFLFMLLLFFLPVGVSFTIQCKYKYWCILFGFVMAPIVQLIQS